MTGVEVKFVGIWMQYAKKVRIVHRGEVYNIKKIILEYILNSTMNNFIFNRTRVKTDIF